MSVTRTYVGVDIAKSTFEAILQVGTRQVARQFDNDARGFRKLSGWLARQQVGQVWAVQEATGRYGEALAHYLVDQGHDVSIVNPVRIKAYGASKLQRAKTDRRDALLILDFARTQQPPRWTPPSPAQQELRDLVRRVADLQQLRQQELNRLEAEPHPVIQASIATVVVVLDEQLRLMKEAIEVLVRAHPDLRHTAHLLCSIPGIALLTAVRLMVELPPIHQFTSVKQLVAHAGLAPKVHQSGSSVFRSGHTSRMGNAVLRAQLYMPALVALRHNSVIKALGQRLECDGKPKMVIVVAAMRKLLHLVFGVLKSDRPFDASIPLKALAGG